MTMANSPLSQSYYSAKPMDYDSNDDIGTDCFVMDIQTAQNYDEHDNTQFDFDKIQFEVVDDIGKIDWIYTEADLNKHAHSPVSIFESPQTHDSFNQYYTAFKAIGKQGRANGGGGRETDTTGRERAFVNGSADHWMEPQYFQVPRSKVKEISVPPSYKKRNRRKPYLRERDSNSGRSNTMDISRSSAEESYSSSYSSEAESLPHSLNTRRFFKGFDSPQSFSTDCNMDPGIFFANSFATPTASPSSGTTLTANPTTLTANTTTSSTATTATPSTTNTLSADHDATGTNDNFGAPFVNISSTTTNFFEKEQVVQISYSHNEDEIIDIML